MPVLFNDLAKDTLVNVVKMEGIVPDSKMVNFVDCLSSFENDFKALPDLKLSKSIYPYDFYVSTISDVRIAIFKLEDTNLKAREVILSTDCYLYLRYDGQAKKYDAYLSKELGFNNGTKKIKLRKYDIVKYIKVLEANKDTMRIVKCANF